MSDGNEIQNSAARLILKKKKHEHITPCLIELHWLPSPPLPRPKKNFALFAMNESDSYFPKEIFEGAMGSLPILMAVNVGYDPEELDPYMYPYESQEVLFAYKKDSQTRALLQDSHRRTLSLPLSSPVTFHVGLGGTEERTLSEIMANRSLPVTLKIARPETIDFKVDNQLTNHTFFGELLLKKTYEEPFLWCLSIEGFGKIREIPRVLPRNLRDVCFAPIVAIKGAADPAAKVKEFIQRFTDYAQNLDYKEDPFFQELAFVSRGPLPVDEVKPYIEQDTFVAILYKRRPAPMPPEAEAPAIPERKPVTPPLDKSEKKRVLKEKLDKPDQHSAYSPLRFDSFDEHIYCETEDLGSESKETDRLSRTKIVHPFRPEPGHSSLPGIHPTNSSPPPIPSYSSRDAALGESGPDRGEPSRGVLSMKVLTDSSSRPLSDMSVEDVISTLKELGLKKYVMRFRKNRIDGVLLQRLSEEMFKTEFRMTEVEILRLKTFIKEGHIPRGLT